MKNKFLAASCLCILLLNMAGFALTDDNRKKKPVSRVNGLARLLPATDGVVTLDVKRFFSMALPKLLAANQPMMDKVTAKIDEMKAKTGIDIRQFDHIAAGVVAKKIAEKKYDLEPVIIARGQVNSASLVSAAKLVSNGKYREEKAGEKTVYIFDTKDVATHAKQQVPAVKDSDTADKVISHLSKEIAIVAVDANTVAFGEPGLVRQTVAVNRTPISSELMGLLGKKETSVASFAAKLPDGMSAFLPLENDELGRNIDSIKYMYGSMDVGPDSAVIQMTARTLQNAQATALFETLEGLQMLGKAFLGGSKAPDKQVYARMIENAKLTAKGNEVMLDLQVPQADIDVLVGMIK